MLLLRGGTASTVLSTIAVTASLAACGGGTAGPAPGTADGAAGADASSGDPSTWPVVWEDQFPGTALDPAKWKAEHNSDFGYTNGSRQCYVEDNVQVVDGWLELTAENESYACGDKGAFDYTSGMVTSEGRASFTYGYYEAEIELPLVAGKSEGFWLAWWMRPESDPADSDAERIGEIDILEVIGTPTADEPLSNNMALHYDYPPDRTYPQVEVEPQPELDNPSATYKVGFLWTPDKMAWYLDGEEKGRVTAEQLEWFEEAFSERNQPFFMRLNVAVGGRYPGDPNADTQFPFTMRVNYVTVRQDPDLETSQVNGASLSQDRASDPAHIPDGWTWQDPAPAVTPAAERVSARRRAPSRPPNRGPAGIPNGACHVGSASPTERPDSRPAGRLHGPSARSASLVREASR